MKNLKINFLYWFELYWFDLKIRGFSLLVEPEISKLVEPEISNQTGIKNPRSMEKSFLSSNKINLLAFCLVLFFSGLAQAFKTADEKAFKADIFPSHFSLKAFGSIHKESQARLKAFGGIHKESQARLKAFGGIHKESQARLKAFGGIHRESQAISKAFEVAYEERNPAKRPFSPAFIERKIKSSTLKKSSLGLLISKIQKDNKVIPLYSLNGERLFAPASLAKIPALSAFRHYYPPSWTFKTSFVSSASLKEGVLHGDLILKGGGDSSFTSESLWNLVNNLTRSGLKEVKGDLLIDDSLYTKEPFRPYSERSYMAPASASSFNWNSVAFYIRPGQALKSPAFVFANPENAYIKIVNKVVTGKKNQIKIQRRAFSKKEVFEIRGKVNINEEELVYYRNITQPALWLGYNILSFLRQRGIKVSGQVKKGLCLKSLAQQGSQNEKREKADFASQRAMAQVKSQKLKLSLPSRVCRILAEWESRPLPFHFYNLMKYSSNFVAKMLASHLPLLEGRAKGDLKQGMKKIKSYLKNVEGITNFVLKEPSGLHRGNRLAPRDLQKILIRSYKNFYSPEMLFSYPLAGGEGTLSDRLAHQPPLLLRAKTGSLSGALGLAGWLKSSKTKEHYVFVFIFNGKVAQSLKAQKLFDELILSLAN